MNVRERLRNNRRLWRYARFAYANTLVGFCIERMIQGVYTTYERETGVPYGPYSLNPEDWQDIAGLMLYGLIGREPPRPK